MTKMRLLLGIAGLVCAAGCAAVKPWERERLGSPQMQFQVDEMGESQLSTVLEITEGSTFGGTGPGSAGAGCGCH